MSGAPSLAERLTRAVVPHPTSLCPVYRHMACDIEAQSWSKPFGRAAPAGVVELVDTPDLGSGGASLGGSSPFARTSRRAPHIAILRFLIRYLGLFGRCK